MDHEPANLDRAEGGPLRAGAHALAPVAPSPLPQTVWLRGDEAHCDEFSLDAEAVMQQLGIRRSRLTQISGKELRVARIRRGRYVSPVYRQVDVDAYLALTRATASHLRSSSVLNDAAASLKRQGDELGDRLTTVPDALAQRVEARLARTEQTLTLTMFERTDALSTQMARLASAVRQAEAQAAAARPGLALVASQLQSLGEAVALQGHLLNRLMTDIRALSAEVRLGQSDAQEAIAALTLGQGELLAAEQELACELARRSTPKPGRARTGSAARRRLRRLAGAEAIASPGVARPRLGRATPRPRRR